MGILNFVGTAAVVAALVIVIYNQVRLGGRQWGRSADDERLRTLDSARVSALQVVVSSLVAELSTRDELLPLLGRARSRSLEVNGQAMGTTSDEATGGAVALEIEVLFQPLRSKD